MRALPLVARLAAIALVAGVTAGSGAADSVRRQRVCLNGVWRIATADRLPDQPPAEGWQPARVPGLFRSYAPAEFAASVTDSADQQRPEPAAAWYRLDFPVPDGWGDGRRVLLNFRGLLYLYRVRVNSAEVANGEGFHLPLVADVTDQVRWGQRNRLEVGITAHPLGERVGREGRYAGIWRDVWLECHPATSLRNIRIETSVRRRRLLVRAEVGGAPSGGLRVEHDVLLDGKPVLSLPATALRGGSSRVSASWRDPILWGMAPHGQPVLYWLRSRLVEKHGGRVVDEVRTRFGFREFWAEGRRFMLNGKPLFIKGDLVSFVNMATETREWITQFLQAERAANVNFIRLHCYFGFEDDAWLDVADELGMIIEPQQYIHDPEQAIERNGAKPGSPEAKPYTARFEILQREWSAYVQDHLNRPSIVMYSVDNEAVSQGDWGQPDVGQTVHPATRSLARVHQLVRSLDPVRLIEEQGDVRLGTAHKLGQYRELQVFNAHPYGDPLGIPMKALMDTYACPDDVPVHVGEVYASPQDPWNWWTRPASMARRPGIVHRQLTSWGEYAYRSILSCKEYGASGVSLCSGLSSLWFGSVSPTEVRCGAWDVSMMDADFSDPEVSYGRGRSVNIPVAEIRWPSLSGPGIKPRWWAQFAPHGYGFEFNWFDPSRPAFVTTVANDYVRRAFHDVDGADVGPLRQWRSPELVVCVPPRQAGEIVFAGDEGALVAPDGTARFILPEACIVEVSCPALRARTKVRAFATPLKPEAGYGYVQWVSLGGAKTEPLRHPLTQPVELQLVDEVAKPDNRAAWDVAQEQAVVANGPWTVQWGDTRLMESGAFAGVAPGWATVAVASGGRQDPRALSYRIPAEAGEYEGMFQIGLDRKQVRGNVRLEIEALDTGYLYLMLKGEGWNTIVNNLTESSLLTNTGQRVTKTIEVPLGKYPEATVIVLARYHGPIEVFRTTLTPLW